MEDDRVQRKVQKVLETHLDAEAVSISIAWRFVYLQMEL